jgi:YD repeat-containing protein
MRADRIILLLPLLLFLLGLGACDPQMARTSGPVPEDKLGGTSSAVDRSQPVVPAVSNQEGGVAWPFVNLWSGNLVVVYPVLQVPSVGPDWDLNFYYNSSLAGEMTTLGRGWRHSYEIALLIGVPDPSSITVRWGDGRRDVFVFDGSGWAAAPALHGRRITQVGGDYELRTKHGFVYAFDDQGRLTAMRDRNGNAMTFAYDGNGLLATTTDAAGRTCQWTHDAQGQLTALSGLGAAVLVSCEYQGALLVRARDRAGNACDLGYNGAQVLASVTDGDGDGITVEYDPNLTSVVTRVTTTDGAERRIAYNSATLETSVTDVIAQGVESVTMYTFDVNATCLAVTDGPLGTTANSYDAANNLVSHTDADAHMTSLTYSPEGDLTSTTDPTGATVTLAYDQTYHLVVSIQDAAGNVWNGQRDANGNLTAWANPLGQQAAYGYDAQGLMTSSTDRRGNVTAYAYNAAGDLIQRTDPAGATVTFAYNPRGVPVSITDEEGHTIAIALTVRDEVAEVTLPDARTYRATWTAGRMLASVEDPRGAMTSWLYNDRKQVVSTTDPMGFTSSLVRDGAGWVIEVVNAMGNATQIGRDLAGRILQRVDADGGVRSFTLGSCDILARTDPHGTMNYQYSPRHELVAAQAADGSVAIAYGWDPRRLLVSASLTAAPDPPIAYTIAHDAAGRRTSVTTAHLANRVASFLLDAEGNVLELTSNRNPAPVLFAYDNENQCQSVSAGAPPLAANLTYTPRGLLDQIAYANGVLGIYGYNANRELMNAHYQGPGFVADYFVNYDASGNRTRVHGILPPPIGPRDVIVDYDPRRQPIMVNQQPGPGPLSIIYNPVRDRTHMLGPNGPVPYAYTGAQRMVSAGPTALQWDAAGGCTQVASPGTTTNLSYRADGALKTLVQNGQVYQLKVGPLGEIARVVLPSGASRWYALDVADAGLLRREIAVTPGGAPLDGFVFVPGLAERGMAPSPVGASSAPVLWLKSPQSIANRRATLTDPWGSIAVVADGNGNLLTARSYGLFGEVVAQANPQPIAQGFLGMEAEEGLNAPLLLGLSTGDAGASLHDASAAGVGSLAPYLPETGSFLFDAGPGADGIFAGMGFASLSIAPSSDSGPRDFDPGPLLPGPFLDDPNAEPRGSCYVPFGQVYIPPRPEGVRDDFRLITRGIVKYAELGAIRNPSFYIDQLDYLIGLWLFLGYTEAEIRGWMWMYYYDLEFRHATL